MNEFLQQFLIESRELVDVASEGLLALERSPHDTERLDEVFRAFHTLKGSAGIVDFSAMETAVHAAEGVLTEARAGRLALTPARIGDCLACLDQVAEWLDTLERSGALPERAASQAGQIVERIGLDLAQSADEPLFPQRASAVWLIDILRHRRQAASRALSAVRFVPAEDCLRQGEDPLGRMTSLPQLLALDVAAQRPWGALDTLDPFSCNLILTALSAAPAAQLREHLHGRRGECEIVTISGRGENDLESALPQKVTAIIKAQQALIDELSPQSFAGRVGSAGGVAANALRSCERAELAERVSRATEQSLLALSAQPLEQTLAQLFIQEPTSAPGASAELVPSAEIAPRTFRIDAEQVDALVRLAGELTVINNAFGHAVKLAQAGDPSLADVLKDRNDTLERLVAELQRAVLRMRVRPLRTVLQRFPRLVREMSAALGKSIQIVIEGDETEADKAIVEMLFEPLLHVVRNAIDHGLEPEGDRAAAGKAPLGTVRIAAQRRADHVQIEVSDDGSGIDLARVREVAVARGIVREDHLSAMTDAEVLNLIFAPGFSTTAEVTQMSGRGVGMDAVRRAVERIGGQVSLESAAGLGTKVRLSLPFSVLMTHLLTVEAGGQMFGVPLEAIIETTRVPQAAISKMGAASVVVLRNRTLPLIDLATVLGVGSERTNEDGATLVVAVANGEWGAFRVDRIVERLDLIVKPLEGLLAGTPGITGTTLLGDGRVLLVLDISEMFQ